MLIRIPPLLFCLAAITAVTLNDSLLAQDVSLNWAKARDVTTEKQLQTEAGASRPMADQLASMKKPLGEKVPTSGNSLYTKSIILFDGAMYTLIPVGSVLHLPANLRNHVLAKPQGDFTVWPNFLERNSAWLTGKEVPLKMAKGDAKLASAVLKEVSGSSKLLVSVYRQCPISVLEAESGATAAAKP
jgi:hypothetical protein